MRHEIGSRFASAKESAKLFSFIVSLVLLTAASTAMAQRPDVHEEPKTVEREADLSRSTAHQEGLRVNKPFRVAIVGATVHRDATSEPSVETILINRSRIEAIGADLELPAGTKVVDATGKHCYPGLIDAYVGNEFEFSGDKGTAYWNENIQSQLSVAESLKSDSIKIDSMRKAGFTAALVAPNKGVIHGQSSLVLLSNFENEHVLLAKDIAQHMRLTINRRNRLSGYPSSPMGAVALARQALYDAQWYQKAWQVAKADSSVQRPESNAALEALQPAIEGSQPVMVETSNELFVGRADRFAKEFGLNLIVLGSGNEYRRLDEVANINRPIVLPINFPKAPDVSSPEMAANVSLEDMMHWDHAPENPGRLSEKNIKFVLTSNGLKNKSEFLSNLRTAVKRGLPPKKALAAVTIDTARLYGVDELIGTLEKGKIANITVTDDDLFTDKSKVVETWVDGARYQAKKDPLRNVAGDWKLKGKGLSGKLLAIKSGKGSLSATIKSAEPKVTEDEDEEDSEKSKKKKDDGVKVKPISLSGTRLSGVFRSDEFGNDGISLFSLIVGDDGKATGQVTLPNGKTTPLSAVLQKNEVAKSKKPEKENDKEWDALTSDETKSTKQVAHGHGEKKRTTKPASYPVNYPLGAYGRTESPEQPASVLIQNVTIWTLDDRGKIENGSVLVADGKIKGVFAGDAELPEAEMVVDGEGCHLTPGIIDCHSHMASDSGINEGGQVITAEVRIGDMIDCDDITIYRQLGGGVTTSNILHGSANPIGGQNQVIKLRWGAGEQEMKFESAPKGIKFALGENVKQSRSSTSTRYPQTRMGVEQIIDDAFRAAKDYAAEHERWNENRNGLPPRRNLELDAIAEIVDGKRWVHCHSYRQDEILALIRTLDSHKITIGSFQHILEGYKVADAMAAHGATASAFADWWAYKYEVKDAIPYAGALMHRAGVVVSFNSDDGELARHLNHEAAKAVKYGGVPEIEALKFVTLNPAKQLRIDDRVGSIEKGKDADLVLWSGHPLSNLSFAKQTWIDGRKYFDREEDMDSQKEVKSMRLALIQKILESGEEMASPNRETIDQAKLWPRYDEYCHGHGHDDHDH